MKQIYFYLLFVFLLRTFVYAQAPDTLWTRSYNNPPDNNDWAQNCVVDDSGNLYVIGWSDDGGTNICLSVKYNTATGDTAWTSRNKGPLNLLAVGYGCAIDYLGNLYVTGYSQNGMGDGCLTMKYNTITGDTVWARLYNGLSNNNAYGTGCAADDAGNIYSSGYSLSVSNVDYLVIKYIGATGDTAWTRMYNGPDDNDDFSMGCAVDSSGNLYVTGWSKNGANNDYLTIKINTATGDTLWARSYNGPADSTDNAFGCVVDGMGNLYVTGGSHNGINMDYLTIKYNAVTGDTLWTRRYNGPADGSDIAYACAVDGSGNLYVTGSSSNGLNNNYLTVKYNTNTGDTVWSCRYYGIANSGSAKGCAVDKLGNLYVTGYSPISATYDYLTIKYNTATGVEGKPELPMTVSKLRLEQNKPNPFSQHTTISYQLPTSGPASLNIYNAAGQLVKTFNIGHQQTGYHQVEWSDSSIPAGVYFYRLIAGNYQATKKLIVVK